MSAGARNLQANPSARVQIGRESGSYRAHQANPEEMAKYWPEMVAAYPAYQKFYARSGERFVFVLEATSATQLVRRNRRRSANGPIRWRLRCCYK